MKIKIENGGFVVENAYPEEEKKYLWIKEACPLGSYRRLGFDFSNNVFCLSVDEVKHLMTFLRNWLKEELWKHF